jgi:signal transduction histidine kinase
MIRNRPQALRTTLILLFSGALVVLVTWFVPGLAAASLNALFRLRGPFRPPADIVIVAIDDRSLQSIGQRRGPWPWPRSVMAEVLDKLTAAGPRAIGLDVIYAEASTAEDDRRLAAALARNGRVILPAQLYETMVNGLPVTAWLRPLPEFANAAKALGHAHISPEVDGMVRNLQLSKADDRGERLWAFGLEVVRAADGIPASEIEEQPGALRLGPYRIPIRDEGLAQLPPGVTVIRPNEMMVNFAGPTGTFRSYSLVDVLDGKVPAAGLADKIVLIGAVAASMGDSRVVPFMHYNAEQSAPTGPATPPREGGQEMPGVEIHANVIHTLRHQLSLRVLPEGLAFACALGVILLAALAINWLAGWQQLTVLGLLLLAILLGSYVAFSRFLIVPPLAPMLTGFAAVIPLLLNRALAASRELDLKLAALVSSQPDFLATPTQAGADFTNHQLGLVLPQSLTWKLRTVDDLTARLLARMSFINRILSSMDEGVLVTDLAGRIVFANREARHLFGRLEDDAEETLIGAAFTDFLLARGALDATQLREALSGVALGGNAQLEFALTAGEPRYFSLQLSPLATGPAEAAEDATALLRSSPSLALAGQPIGIVALISDITRRVELDRMKTETLQLVSHELRTPLTSIQGLSDVLLKFPVPAEQTREMLTTIHAEAVRLGETINRYLDLTRLESGAQPLQLAELAVAQLVGDCVRNLAVFAAERRIRLTTQLAPELPPLHADAQLLTQALSNLLSNAIKYSPPDTEVVISAACQPGSLTLSVRDHGYGIPAEARERIFEKFFRLQRDTASDVVGTGLGLPLVKEIVEQHGGRLSLTSRAGSGSTFTLHLPLRVT